MHTIRLRGPWEIEAVERFVECGGGRYERVNVGLPASARARVPADWSQIFGANYLGRVLYRRTFHKPTGLDGGELVWLVVEPQPSRGVVELNCKRLGEVVCGCDAGRFDITEFLEDHNILEIVVEHPVLDEAGASNDYSNTSSPGGLVGEVRLEIEE